MSVDFRRIHSQTRLYNFHSHTQYCDGRASVADFAAEAAACGFLHYGFSPHSPVPVASACNMSTDDVGAYMADVDEARIRHDGQIQFYTGMEIDYLGPMWGPANSYFRDLGLDYAIGSVHFIPAKDGTLVDIDGSFERFRANMSKYFDNDIRYVVDTYFSRSLDMLAAGGFDVIGHFDKVAQNASCWQADIEEQHWYADWIDRMLNAIVSSGIIVEINTKSYARFNRLFPALRHLPRIIEAGIPLIVNSDAHEPKLINASREYAFGLLDGIAAARPHQQNPS